MCVGHVDLLLLGGQKVDSYTTHVTCHLSECPECAHLLPFLMVLSEERASIGAIIHLTSSPLLYTLCIFL